MAAVPVIDIAPYGGDEADKRQLAKEVDRACRDIGFLVISGHGVPEDLIARLNAVTNDFFALPEDIKRQYLPPNPTVFRGFSPMKAAALAHSLDNKDAMIECILTCQSPDAPPKYAPITSGEHLFAKLSKMMVPQAG